MADSNPTQVTQYQTGFAPEIAPYAQQLLGAAAGSIYDYARDAQGNVIYDATGMPQISGLKQYIPYPGERIAQFSPLQQQAFKAAGELGPNAQTTQAARDAASYAAQAAGSRYTPGTFTSQFQAPEAYQPGKFSYLTANAPDLQQYQMKAPSSVTGVEAQAAQLGEAPTYTGQQFGGPETVGMERVGAERVSALPLQQLRMDPARDINAPNLGATPLMQAQTTGYAPQLQQFQMRPAERISDLPQLSSRDIQAAQTTYAPQIKSYEMGPAQQVGTQQFSQQAAEGLMSPYMQSVVARQQQAAQREADIASQAQKAQFAQAGAFGGGRQGVAQARAAEALARQKGDIQAQGLQSAYQQAQQQFNVQQQAAMQAALANQQAGLTVGQQNLAAQQAAQQLGVQTGTQLTLANLTNQQQAAVQNEANRLQAQGMTAQQAMQAALANQQAGLTTGQQNLAAQLGVQQLGTQTGTQLALANLSNQQQAEVQNQAARLQNQGMSAQQALQVAMANQQNQQQANLQNLSAGLQTQGLQAQTGLQAQQLNQATGLQAALADRKITRLNSSHIPLSRMPSSA